MYIKIVNSQKSKIESLEKRGKKQESRKMMIALLFSCFLFFSSLEMKAQCAMCRAALETEEGGIKAEAVNDGILYLMVIPYLLVGILGFAIYKMYFKKKKKSE